MSNNIRACATAMATLELAGDALIERQHMLVGANMEMMR